MHFINLCIVEQKDVLISLIVQDMRHHQLIIRLQEAGLQVDRHYLEIVDIVCRLMRVDESCDGWLCIYQNYMDRSVDYEISYDGHSLLPLAIECYEMLLVVSHSRS